MVNTGEPTINVKELKSRLWNLRDYLEGASKAQWMHAKYIANGQYAFYGPIESIPGLREETRDTITPSDLISTIESLNRSLHHSVMGRRMGIPSTQLPGEVIIMGSSYPQELIEIVSAVDNGGVFSKRFAELYKKS